jgi:hypothetical protein
MVAHANCATVCLAICFALSHARGIEELFPLSHGPMKFIGPLGRHVRVTACASASNAEPCMGAFYRVRKCSVTGRPARAQLNCQGRPVQATPDRRCSVQHDVLVSFATTKRYSILLPFDTAVGSLGAQHSPRLQRCAICGALMLRQCIT